MKINNYKDLLEARKQKEIALKKIKEEFEIETTIANSKITIDLLNLISNKLSKILIQKQNKEVLELEEKFNLDIDNVNKKNCKLRDEIEDILALITSSIGQKKRVEKITYTDINTTDGGFKKYIAYLSNGVQYEVKSDSDVELGRRYLEIKDELSKNDSEKNTKYNQLQQEIKKIYKDYVENDFSEYLEELSYISKTTFYSVKDLKPNEFISFYGSKEDFDQYKTILFKINTINKQIQELNNSKNNN